MEEDAKERELNALYVELVEPNILDLFGRLAYHSDASCAKLAATRVLLQNGELARLRELFRRLGVDVSGL